MKLQQNPRLANFTKSAVTIGILLPRVPLHYRCLPNTLVVPFLTLTLQRGTVIRHIERPNLVFPPFLRNGTNLSINFTQTSHVCVNKQRSEVRSVSSHFRSTYFLTNVARLREQAKVRGQVSLVRIFAPLPNNNNYSRNLLHY